MRNPIEDGVRNNAQLRFFVLEVIIRSQTPEQMQTMLNTTSYDMKTKFHGPLSLPGHALGCIDDYTSKRYDEHVATLWRTSGISFAPSLSRDASLHLREEGMHCNFRRQSYLELTQNKK